MKSRTIVGIIAGVVVLTMLVLGGAIWAGTALAQGPGGWSGMGYGMMGGRWLEEADDSSYLGCARTGGPGWQTPRFSAGVGMPCGAGYYGAPADAVNITPEQVEGRIDQYVEQLGYEDLKIAELMEFERNYYAILAEAETGIGAMEVLVDKSTGAVGPEPGPNMMWNSKYGMMGGGAIGCGAMGGYLPSATEMTVSAVEAETIAQRWLDGQNDELVAGEADPFYGYYTLHFMNEDGEIEGMLSVHGTTGGVWYHSWHGDFVAMISDHD